MWISVDFFEVLLCQESAVGAPITTFRSGSAVHSWSKPPNCPLCCGSAPITDRPQRIQHGSLSSQANPRDVLQPVTNGGCGWAFSSLAWTSASWNSPENVPCRCWVLSTSRFDLRTRSPWAALLVCGGVAGHSAGHQTEVCFEVMSYQGSGSYSLFHISLSHPWLQVFINQPDFLPQTAGEWKGLPTRLSGKKDYEYF